MPPERSALNDGPAALIPSADGAREAVGVTRVRTAGIAGVGAALPPRRMSSAQIAERLQLADGWIERRTGISERRYVSAGEGVAALARSAGAAALEDARMHPAEVDLLLVATLAADDVTPGAAPLVAEALGCTNAAAIDIGAACTGSLAAIALGSAWIESGRANDVLVIGSEVLSRFTNHEDRRTAPLFGDGAGALLLSSAAKGAIGPILLYSDGSAASMIRARKESGLLEVEGHETFLRAISELHSATNAVLSQAGRSLSEVDLFVYHQANGRILKALADRLGLPRERVFDCIADTGNTSAASLPIALERARKLRVLRPGMRLVLGALGAGLTWGAAVVEWEL
jgi:3-oxoacyl-[acyl-carrier-protein] synthase-3